MQAGKSFGGILFAFAFMAASASCIPEKPDLTGSAPPPPRFPEPAGAASAYFSARYAAEHTLWHVLGPFPTPLDPLSRDLLVYEGGEEHLHPSRGAVTVPPGTTTWWKTVRPLAADRWIPAGFRTRYTGYVPVFQGAPGNGSRTAVALSERYLDKGLYRILFRAWGMGRLEVNGRAVIPRVEFPGFFGQQDTFCRLKEGRNRFIVKLVNSAYNRTADADKLFGSWGFALSLYPAGEVREKLYADISFLEDPFMRCERLYGTLSLRNRGNESRPALLFSITSGSAHSFIPAAAPPPGEETHIPFMLHFPDGITAPRTLTVKTAAGTLFQRAIAPRFPIDAFFLRCIQSPSDGSLQPYLVYCPPLLVHTTPVLYLHGRSTTEEELAAWPSGLVRLAGRRGFGVIAPRARERACFSAQAHDDMLLSLNDGAPLLNAENRQAVLAGSGTGAVCALQLAARFPHLFKGLFLCMENPFEMSPGDRPDLSVLQGVSGKLSRLKRKKIIVAAGKRKELGRQLVAMLEQHSLSVRLVEVASRFAPFAGSLAAEGLRSLLVDAGEPPYNGMEAQVIQPGPGFDRLLSAPLTVVIPGGRQWTRFSEMVLRRQTFNASFGRSPGARRSCIVTAAELNGMPGRNLLLVGRPSENPLLKRYALHLEYSLSDDTFTFGTASFSLQDHIVFFVCRDPFNEEALCAVMAGERFGAFAKACAEGALEPFAHYAAGGKVRIWRWDSVVKGFVLQ